MKRTLVLLLLLSTASVAQESSTHPFWDTQQKVSFAVNVGLGAWDSAHTCVALANGAREVFNPTQSCAGNVALIMVGKVGLTGVQGLLWKTGKPKLRTLSHVIGWVAAGGSATAIATSRSK